MDRCRVWESHADTDDWRVVKPTLERVQPVYAVSEPMLGPTEQIVAAITGPSVGLADLETMLRRLLPAILAQTPPPISASTHLETMLQHLLPVVPAQAPPPRPEPTELDTMLKCLLPGTLTQALQARSATARRDWPRGKSMPNVGGKISLHVSRMVGGEERRSLRDDFTTPDLRTTPVGKR